MLVDDLVYALHFVHEISGRLKSPITNASNTLNSLQIFFKHDRNRIKVLVNPFMAAPFLDFILYVILYSRECISSGSGPNPTPSYYSVQFHVYLLLIALSIIDSLNISYHVCNGVDCSKVLTEGISKDPEVKSIISLNSDVNIYY